jgi:hypothetical protein
MTRTSKLFVHTKVTNKGGHSVSGKVGFHSKVGGRCAGRATTSHLYCIKLCFFNLIQTFLGFHIYNWEE